MNIRKYIDSTYQTLLNVIPKWITGFGFFLKTIEEFETYLLYKKCFCIFGNAQEKEFQTLCLQLPYILTKSWITSIPLRIVDATRFPLLKERYTLSNMPTLIVFEKGEIAQTIIGKTEISTYFTS